MDCCSSKNFLGTPLSLSGDVTRNQLFTVAGFFSNLLRGLSVHLVLPFRSFNRVAEQIVFWIHENVLALDVSDPQTTIIETEFKLPVTRFDNPLFVSESVTGNPVHLIVLLVAVFLYASQKKNWSAGRNIYLLNVLVVLVVFNILIAWQPWISRLHLPFFVLVSPLVGTIVACYLNRFGMHCLVALMIVSSAKHERREYVTKRTLI